MQITKGFMTNPQGVTHLSKYVTSQRNKHKNNFTTHVKNTKWRTQDGFPTPAVILIKLKNTTSLQPTTFRNKGKRIHFFFIINKFPFCFIRVSRKSLLLNSIRLAPATSRSCATAVNAVAMQHRYFFTYIFFWRGVLIFCL